MGRKNLVFIFIVLLTTLFDNASAVEWTGLGSDDSWCTGANWDTGVPYLENVTINPVTPRDPVIDCDVDVDFVMGPRYFGDNNQSIDIVSGNIRFNYGWRMGTDGSGESRVNITGGNVEVETNGDWTIRAADTGSLYWNQSGGSVYCINDRFRVGDGNSYTEFNISGSAFLSINGNWKWGDEGDVLMNMSGGSIDVYGDWELQCRDFSNNDVNMTGGDIWVGGNIKTADSSRNTLVATINLKSGTIDAYRLLLPTENQGTGILNMTGGTLTCRSELRVPNAFGGTGEINLDGGIIETASFYIDAGGTLDVNDGVLIIDGDVRDDIIADIDDGYITANDEGAVIVDYNSFTNKTVLWAEAAVSFETSASSDLEAVSPVVLTVVLHNPPDGNTVTVKYAATGGTAVGGGDDYTLYPGTLTFNPGGPTSQTIEITVVNDGNDEPDETIVVILSEPNNAVIGKICEYTYTILDPRPYVEFNTETSNVKEGFSPAEIPVSLSQQWNQTVTINYNVTGGTAQGGGEDYTFATGTLQFDPYELTSYISIDIVDDDLKEVPDETIEITLSAPKQAKLGTKIQHILTILPPIVLICPQGDLDGDCDVDYNDVKLFTAQWLDPAGSCSGFDCGDIDGLDGVNLYDYSLLAANWYQDVFPVVINEFMASNDSTEPDDANEYDDWLELYNAGPVARDIGGMYLTDNLGNPTKWQIPGGLTIEAREYIVFWADDDEEQGPTHTNFKLSSLGEELGLFDTDGSTLLDSVTFGAQVADISYGLYPDASTDRRFFGIPTPGWENIGAYLGEVADTKFSHGRGFYESSFNLSITCDTPDSNIYYTLDGSEPNESVGTLYTGPIIDINQTTVLRAGAFKPGYLHSNVDAQTYIFLDDVVNQPDMSQAVVTTYGAGFVKDALKSVPTLSIVMDPANLAIIQNEAKPEFPTSVELIYADHNGPEGFQVNSGISIHSHVRNKQAFRLEFKAEFGASKLRYPFFESAAVNAESAVDVFDRIILRSPGNMHATFVGDIWAAQSQIAMCGIGSHSTQVHLYINGRYEGLYNPKERPDAWFTSAYFGGDFDDYFATNHGIERCCGESCPVILNSPCHLSGDNTRFDQMMELTYERSLADANKYEEFKTLCDVEEYADYTILFWESGFGDTMNNNWYAGMRNVPSDGFMMFMWDAEYVFLNEGHPPGNEDPWVPPYYFEDGYMISDIWLALFDNPDFRMTFADRVYKHCFNEGVLTDQYAQERWDALTDQIAEAGIGEIARWADKVGGFWRYKPVIPPVTVDMTGHVDIFINALRTWSDPSWPGIKLYPNIDPPTFNLHGGQVAVGFGLTMTNPNGSGTVYYTLDGSDPRQPVTGNPVGIAGTVTTLNESTHVKARVYDSGEWSSLNEVTFAVGPVADNLRNTEIMYHPLDTSDPNDPNTEYIELKNLGPEMINLNLVRFTNGIDFTFPAVSLSSGEHVLVVKDQNAFEAKYGTGRNIAGRYSGSLNNGGERFELEDPIGQMIHNFRFSDGWRGNTDGDGYSLTIIDPANSDPNSWDEKDSWRPSVYVNGSPGWDDSGILPNPGAIVINEIMSHSHELPDWIELYNTTGVPIDIGGWFLSDNDSNLTKYKIAAGTTIQADNYLLFYEDVNFGDTNDPGCIVPFALSENGEQICLSSGYDSNGLLTGFRQKEDFGTSESNVSFGRYYKSSTDNYNFVAMDSNTPGTANAYPKVGPIVINEIMYHPDWPDMSPYNNDNYEYVELCNISDSNVTLYDYTRNKPWKFTDGIEFSFPQGPPITIPAGGYFLVVKDPVAFSWRNPDVPTAKILGPYDGRLNNAGEKLEISMPGDVNESSVLQYIRVDRVSYSDGFHPEDTPGGIDLWPTEADGGGASISRIILPDYGNDPNNWEPSMCVPEYGPADLAYLVDLIMQYPGHYVGPTDPNFDQCLDLSSAQVGVPDQWLGPEDVVYLDNRISNVPSY